MTTHKPTIRAHKEIKKLKNELAKLLFDNYMTLSMTDKDYVDIMMDDEDIEDDPYISNVWEMEG